MSHRRQAPPLTLQSQQQQQEGQVSSDAPVTSPKAIQHVPVTPSKLRTPHFPGSSPEDSLTPGDENVHTRDFESENSAQGRNTEGDGQKKSSGYSPSKPQVHSRTPSEPNIRTRLLSNKASEQQNSYGTENSSQASRPQSPKSYASSNSIHSKNGFGGLPTTQTLANESDPVHNTLGDAVTDELLGGQRHGKPTPTHYLAKKHGVKHSRMMYVHFSPFAKGNA